MPTKPIIGRPAPRRTAEADSPDSRQSRPVEGPRPAARIGSGALCALTACLFPSRELKRRRKIESKSTPYIPKSFSKNIGLNGLVTVPELGQEAVAATPAVQCRHFAVAFAKLKGKKRPLMKKFETPQGIRAHFQNAARGLSAVDVAYLRILSNTRQESKRLFDSANLGRYLADVAHALGDESSAHREASCLLLTSDHAMAAHVQRKCKDGVTYYGVKVYDPNATAAYKRITVLDPADLEKMALKDLLIVSPAHYASPEQSTPTLSALCLEESVHLPAAPEALAATCESLFMAMELGFPDHVTAAVNSFCEQHRDAPDELFAALQQTNAQHLRPMTSALEFGQVESVRAFVSALVGTPLSTEQKAQLLAGNDGDGNPALHGAMSHGMSRSVTAFVQAVTALDLPVESQVALLAARSAEGLPALWSVRVDDVSVIQTYFRDVSATALSEQFVVELFAAKDLRGTPVLHAICNEDVAALTAAFVDAVAASALSNERKLRVLSARDSNGVPALSAALEAGRTDAAMAFVERVLASNLPAEHQVSLLAAKDLTSMPGLHRAFVNGHPDTIDAFVRAVAAAPHLSDSQKLSLLATKDASGQSSAAAAVQAGAHGAVEAFARAVTHSELQKALKLEIFRQADPSFEEGDYFGD